MTHFVASKADMDIFEALTWEQIVALQGAALESPGMIVCDGNLSVGAMRGLGEHCESRQIPLWFEPTSFAKCIRGIDSGLLRSRTATYTSPNANELVIMANRMYGTEPNLQPVTSVEHATDMLTPYVRALAEDLDVSHVLVSIGEYGMLHGGAATPGGSQGDLVHYPAIPVDAAKIVNTNGAGDSFVGAAAASIAAGSAVHDAVCTGLEAAALSVQSPHAVSHALGQ